MYSIINRLIQFTKMRFMKNVHWLEIDLENMKTIILCYIIFYYQNSINIENADNKLMCIFYLSLANFLIDYHIAYSRGH